MADAVSEVTDKTHAAKMTAVVLALAAGFALVPRMMRSCEAGNNEAAPDFTARVVANGEWLVDGASERPKEFALSSVRGRPVILDFWATWCGPCQAEAPIVNAIAQRYKDKGLVVVGVNTSDEEGLAERFVRRKGLSFPIVFDESSAIARDYRASTLPTLVVVSKEGKIVAVRHGVTSEADLDALVRRVL